MFSNFKIGEGSYPSSTSFAAINLCNVIDAGYMFNNLYGRASVDTQGFYVALPTDLCMVNAIKLDGMFSNLIGDIILRNVSLNLECGENLSQMQTMFFNSNVYDRINIYNFSTNKNISLMQAFSFMGTRTKDVDMVGINDSYVYNGNYMGYMFNNSIGICNVNFNNFKFNKDKMIDTSYMFRSCPNLTNLNWDGVNLVSSNCEGMFSGCYNLKSLNIPNLYNNNTGYYSQNIFDGCRQLTDLNVRNWDLSNKYRYSSYKSSIFIGLYSLVNLDVSNWNISAATSIQDMFAGCSSLKNLDISNWDTSNVRSMTNLFKNCSSLETVDISNWNIGNITSMGRMFEGCSSLNSMDLSNLDTSNITSMYAMFSRCTNIDNLNFANMNLGNVVSVGELFDNCKNLKNLDISSLNFSKINNVYKMFASSGLENTDILANFDWNSVKYAGFLYENSRISNLNLGNTNISGCNLICMFANCDNLTEITFDNVYITNCYTQYMMPNVMRAGCNINFINISNESVGDGNLILSQCATNCVNINLNIYNSNGIMLNSRFADKYTLVDFKIINAYNVKPNSLEFMFCRCYNLVSVNISNMDVSNVINIRNMFSSCNKLSDASIDSIINMCINAVNISQKNLSNANYFVSPFAYTNISNARYQNRWAELTAAGWTY